MIKQFILFGAAAVALAVVAASNADAFDLYGRTNAHARNFAANRPWHGQYRYTPYGQPTTLVVPPNAHMETVHSWGVSQNTMYPIYHQFGRSVPAYGVPVMVGSITRRTGPVIPISSAFITFAVLGIELNWFHGHVNNEHAKQGSGLFAREVT